MSKLNALIDHNDALISALQAQGIDIYLVGGAVRDALLQREVIERDWVVVGAVPEQLTALGFRRVGKDFPVFLHPSTQEEFALARTERKVASGYNGFRCFAAPEVTLEQDLQRRDLTVNAMALSLSGELVDPYQGFHHLQQRQLQHVSAAFSEDPLRIFRVARFAARYHHLGFSIAPNTLALMKSMSCVEEIQAIAAERIWQETAKALMETSPEQYLSVLDSTGTLALWCPEWQVHLPTRLQALRLATQQHLSLAQRMACLGLTSPLSELNARLKKMRVPNNVQQLLQLTFNLWHRLLNASEMHVDVLLHLYSASDLWRRPQHWQDVLPVLVIWLQLQAPSHWFLHTYLPLNTLAVTAVRQPSPDIFLQQGLQGQAVGLALHAARAEALAAVLANKLHP